MVITDRVRLFSHDYIGIRCKGGIMCWSKGKTGGLKSPGENPAAAGLKHRALSAAARMLIRDCRGMHMHPALCQRQHGCASASTALLICSQSLLCCSL